ncbi:hypothetical protein TcasGA2_TC033654 [Tribolium castaneum]|uniref:Uncharacterized protein n=1 Tax=Tribolium castaneum TaxID=7070 RepID=A0A139WFT7_TRICA|nr:hypothetical protein TcasGA2_TC033654 [Tribolium castaneum]
MTPRAKMSSECVCIWNQTMQTQNSTQKILEMAKSCNTQN